MAPLSTAPPDAAAGRLASACDHVRDAGTHDSVDGVLPAWVVEPATTSELSDVMRVATEFGLAVTARGHGTKLSWGCPPARLDLIVDINRLRRVIDHAAGDLVVHVEAGVALADLDGQLRGSRQRLMLEQTVAGSTVGGTIATATSGPRRIQRGTVRDLLIGVTMVRADGAVAKAGGRVVKNVAGYDLGKLLTGSFGTLGIVSEAIFRLHPLPTARRFVRVPVESAAIASQVTQEVLHSPLVPGALEIEWPDPESGELVVLFEGLEGGVEDRVAAFIGLLAGRPAEVSDAAPQWWARYPWETGEIAVKVTFALSGLSAVLAEFGRERTSDPARIRGSAGAGVLYAAVPSIAAEELAALLARVRRICAGLGGSAVLLDGPPEVKAAVDVWGPIPAIDLMRRVKHEFDPQNTLSPGRFVGGI